MKNVVVVIGAGQIGLAIARRVSTGHHVVVADLELHNAETAAAVLADTGFEVTATTVDVASRGSANALVETAAALGDITGLIHRAGVSPSQAPIDAILKVDLYGTAVVPEESGNVMAPGGSGVAIASQSGHPLPALTAAQDAERANALRVRAEAVRWTPRRRIPTKGRTLIISASRHPRRSRTRRRTAHGPDGAFITGSGILIDGGVTASYFYGELAPQQQASAS